MQVESVAWISEMKNTESGLFFLIAIFFFVRWLKDRDASGGTRGGGNYALTLLFAALAMASKSSTVILPLVLWLCAWWKEGRLQWCHVARVAPVVLMSVAASLLSLWTQKLQQATIPDSQWVRSVPERLAAAGNAVWFYLGKLIWPFPLMTVYPRWVIDAGELFSYLPLLAVLVVLLVLGLNRGSWTRPWFFVFAYYSVALLPILGLVNNYIFQFSPVFDHFQYLASMGPLALAGTGMIWLAQLVLRERTWLQSCLGTGMLLILGMLSWERVWTFTSNETLWADTLSKNPDCWVGQNNLGWSLFQKGELDAAMALFSQALENNPNYAEAHNNLGRVLFQKGQTEEAFAQFHKALEIAPGYAAAYDAYGTALSHSGHVDEAITQYQKALEINPNFSEAHSNLGVVLAQKGRVDEAMAQYQAALEINPDFADAHYNLGNALLRMGQANQAIPHYQKALEIRPAFAPAHGNLGVALNQIGRVDEAIAQYQEALAINPGFVDAHDNLGDALLEKGRIDEAMAQFQQSLRINPHDGKAQNALAKLQAPQANGAK